MGTRATTRGVRPSPEFPSTHGEDPLCEHSEWSGSKVSDWERIWGVAVDEHGINTKRMIVGALTLALVMVLLGVQVSTAPPALAASVAVSPAAGEPGSSATVSGSAFLPLVAVDLCWGGQGCNSLGSATPDVGGEFSASITIPSGIAAGGYPIGACQGVTGCVETSFEVLSRPDDSSTLPSTSSTTTTSTTVPPTAPSTTTTLGSTTTLAGPTTTRPVPTTVASTPTTTSPGQAPPSPAVIVGPPGSTTSTTTPGVEAIAAEPLADAAATPFALDIEALMAELFAPEPPVDLSDPDAVSSAAGLGIPLAATAVDDAAEEEEDEGGSSTVAAAESGGFFGFQIPKFGIWIIWLVVILGSTALVLTADEWRRRRGH